MSDTGSISSDLSELQDGVGLRSDTGSDASEHDSAVDSEPETEAETERLDISPQKARDNVGASGDPDEEADETTPQRPESRLDAMRPGLTAQDILGGDRPSSDAEDDDMQVLAAVAGGRSRKNPPTELAGRKRKRAGSASTPGNDQHMEGAPLKKRSSSNRFERRSADATKGAMAAIRAHTEDAVTEGSSTDEAPAAALATGDGTPGSTTDPDTSDKSRRGVANDDADGNKEDFGELSETAGDEEAHLDPTAEEEVEADGEGDEAEAEAEATAKTEDELAKKMVAMEALVPIEKLFAVFRDRLFDERWAQLSEELAVLNAANTTHPDYVAMRQAIDARRDDKLQLEQVTLTYKLKALESKILSCRAQIHGQYFQDVRRIREETMDKLNEQLSRIHRERRLWQTKEPHFVYNFEPKRSKQIAYQTAYNKEVSILSGIAKHIGFPGAPEIHGATSGDIEDDLRAMNIQPNPQPVSYTSRIASSTRADEVAAEEQFLEKTPWANPQHPAHQQALLDRKSMDLSRAPLATPSNRLVDLHRAPIGSGSTIGVNSDPPSGFAQAQTDTIPNGSSPFEQMKRKDLANSIGQRERSASASNQNNTNDTASTHNSTNTPAEKPGYRPKSSFPPTDNNSAQPPFSSPGIHSNRPSDLYTGNPTFGPRQNSALGTPSAEQHTTKNREQEEAEREREREQQDRYQTASLTASSAADRRFRAPSPPAREGMAANLSVARSFGVR